MRLYEALGLSRGANAFVGGGGKTTAIYKTAEELACDGAAVAVCTTVHMDAPADRTRLFSCKDFSPKSIEKGKTTFVAKELGEEKLGGISDEVFHAIVDAADFVLIEADGAKRMPIKAPRKWEPVIPKGVRRVIGVVGASAMGKTFGEACFHYELLHFVPRENDVIRPKDMARIASVELKKGVDCPFTLLINRIDEAKDEDVKELLRLLKGDRIVAAVIQKEIWEICG